MFATDWKGHLRANGSRQPCFVVFSPSRKTSCLLIVLDVGLRDLSGAPWGELCSAKCETAGKSYAMKSTHDAFVWYIRLHGRLVQAARRARGVQSGHLARSWLFVNGGFLGV
jgi:hypothetical protein